MSSVHRKNQKEMDQNGGAGSRDSVYGRMGGPYDRWVEPTDRSPLGRVQQHYWTTKQTLLRKLGKKEDEYVVASDSQLDAKLELYGSVDDTCLDLDRILGFYQEQLCVLSQEENSLGRFLKEQGKEDKTRAGKMMVAVGKTMSYTAQQRLALRSPLLRLHQEVETFHNRAVKDTAMTVRQMEKVRTEYRGTLMWMKDISQELDPDTYKQLEKFRKVQMQVKKNKQRFDKLKVDCLQKIDLLAASRCNMFSHALVLYQDALLQFWEKTTRTMNHVADGFKGYQHYEFSVVKELCEPSRQLADQASAARATAAAAAAHQQPDRPPDTDADAGADAAGQDTLISFEIEEGQPEEGQPETSAPSAASLTSPAAGVTSPTAGVTSPADDDMLLDLGEPSAAHLSADAALTAKGDLDLLTEMPDLGQEDRDLLEEILSAPSAAAAKPGPWHGTDSGLATATLQDVFGGLSLGDGTATPGGNTIQPSAFMPSQLFGSGTLGDLTAGQMAAPAVPSSSAAAAAAGGPRPAAAMSKSHTKQTDMSAWYNLFADLDPLANPDAVGHKHEEADRNC